MPNGKLMRYHVRVFNAAGFDVGMMGVKTRPAAMAMGKRLYAERHTTQRPLMRVEVLEVRQDKTGTHEHLLGSYTAHGKSMRFDKPPVKRKANA